jgi:hypothetical protein
LKRAIKGAILSAMLLPGLGQIALKQYKKGGLIMGAVLATMGVIVMTAVQQALAVITRLESSGDTIDIDAITTAAQQASSGANSSLIKVLLLVVLALWAYSIWDAYMLGKKQDAMNALEIESKF